MILLMFLFATLYHVIFDLYCIFCWNCKFEKVAEINKLNEKYAFWLLKWKSYMMTIQMRVYSEHENNVHA